MKLIFCNIEICMFKKKRLAAMFFCLFVMAAVSLILPQNVKAAAVQRVTSLEQMEKVFRQSIKKEKDTVQFQSPDSYTAAQIQNEMQDAAKSQGRLLVGSIRITRQAGNSGNYQYRIGLSKDALMKVRVLKSEQQAVKAAAKALKSGKYGVNYYSDESYYDVFRRLLQQHPEYNYDTSVWRNSGGAYGYQGSAALTKQQQGSKMEEADNAAEEAVKKCIRNGMSDQQKAKAVHDYIIKNCQYMRTEDSFTAYGALVNGRAVCQGYVAAFNLMAGKCGLRSMAVCGTTLGGAHAWNYIKIGSKNRYIDCTWDDTGTIGKGIVHTYFNVSAKKMQKEHTWNDADFPSGNIKYMKYFL